MLEQNIDKNIKEAFSEMNHVEGKEMPNVAQKYSIGKMFVEYTNLCAQLRKNYFKIILVDMDKYQIEGKISRDIVIRCLGYMLGPQQERETTHNNQNVL